jgi:hypothetical protein
MTRFFSTEIGKPFFSIKKDPEIQIKSLKIKEMNPRLRLRGSKSLFLKSFNRVFELMPQL